MRRHLLTIAGLAGLVATPALTGAGVAPAAEAAAAASWWQPGRISSWAYVIGEDYPLQVPTNIGNVQVYDADLGDQSGLAANGAPVVSASIKASVAAVHASGAHAICYVDAGTAENWRSDYGQFASSMLGGNLPGWPGERFINVTNWSGPAGPGGETLQQIMGNRVRLCQKEGFDAVEMDNVDAYTDGNLGGPSLTMAQEETYLNRLITVVHNAGLAFFLKNEVNGDSLISTMAPKVDGEIAEQCWQYEECSALNIFVQEGKPVLDVEYNGAPSATLCPGALAFPMATIRTDLALDGKIAYGCWQYRAGSSTTSTAPSTTRTTRTSTTRAITTRPPTTRRATDPGSKVPRSSQGPGPAHHKRAAPEFTSAATAPAVLGRRFSFRVTVSGYPAPTLTHSALPAGLRWQSTGPGRATISGVPKARPGGHLRLELKAANGLASERQVLVITIVSAR